MAKSAYWQKILFLIGLFLLLSTCPSVLAQSEYTLSNTPLSSACEYDYPPFCIVEDDGSVTGFSVELFRAALKNMGRDVTFKTGTWEHVRGLLERGEIDALPLVGRTPERETLFDFTVPYMSLYGAIVVRQNVTNVHDITDLKGQKVAVMKGDNAEEYLRREERNFDIFTTATFEEALHDLSEGRYDAVVLQRLVALRLIQETGLTNLRVVNKPIEGFRQDFCFAVTEGDRETLALLNEGLALIMADGTYRYLHSKWFASMELPTNRRIVIGGDFNYPPYEFLDERGHPTGYNVDLTRAIAQEMGIDVEIRLGLWSDIVASLEKGDIDAIQGMFYSPERDLKFDFTQSHMVNHYVSVVRKGEGSPPTSIEELKNKRIVVQKSDYMHDYLVQNGLANQLTVVDSHEQVLKELHNGNFDCGVVVRISAMYFIEKHDCSDLILGKTPITTADYCYAIHPDQRALLAELSEGLRILEQTGEYRRIHEKWMGVYDERPLTLLTALRFSALIIIPLLFIIAGSLLWSWSLRRQVARKTDELRAKDEYTRAMIACSPVALFSIDKNGTVITWNDSAERLFGWTAEETIGKLLPIVPDDKQDEFIEYRKQVIEGNSIFGKEVVRHKKDGTLFHASLSVSPIFNDKKRVVGIMASIEDITKRKEDEEAIRLSAQRWNETFDAISDLVCIISYDHKILEMNKSGQAILGMTKNDIIGRKCYEIIHDAKQPIPICPCDVVIESHQASSIEYEENGKYYELYAWPIESERGEVESFVHIIKDITDKKKTDAERKKIEEQLIQAQKMETIGRLAGGVAHDFNNLLTIISGNSELALAFLSPEHDLYQYLKDILTTSERATDITRQLLAFSRKQTVKPEVLNLNELIVSHITIMQRLIGEDVDIITHLTPDLWKIEIDPSQIDQILMNFAANSRDAIEGVGSITIETDNVTLDEAYHDKHYFAASGEYVMLYFSDTGPGMDAETQKNIFEPFFTTKSMGKGTGLGLSTVYGIVKQNNGYINVYSEPGMGTTFKVYFPRKHEYVQNITVVGKEKASNGNETILIVEDDKQIIKLTQRMLERYGYTVIACSSTAEAIERVQGASGDIHLLITDVVMPNMNGKELQEQISKLKPDIKVIFMSGYTANVIAHRGVIDKGVNFIQKPFNMRDLAEKVRQVLDNG